MFKLKTRDLWEKISFWKKAILALFSISLTMWFLISWLYNNKIIIDNFIILMSVTSITIVINGIFEIIQKWFLRKMLIKELLEISSKTNLPKKLPKVVHVYTTHNDFWEARLLQTMKQTYKNVEYWVSDGSSNKEKSKKIQEFCKKYNVKYHSLNRPSINKSDNLNHFLKHSGAKFDYLLITDSDCAVDKNFLSSSIKFFFYKEQKKLGWVASNMTNYKGNNLWNNVMLNSENYGFVKIVIKNVDNTQSMNLFSSATLIKRELLEDFGLKFPDSCLEDSWLEGSSIKKGWIGIVNPLTISLQSYDNNIISNFTRVLRINDWIFKWIKTNLFNYWNDEKNKYGVSGFRTVILILSSPLIMIPILSLLTTITIFYWNSFVGNEHFIWSIITIIITNFLSIIIYLASIFFIAKKYTILYLIFKSIYSIAIFWFYFVRGFTAFFCSKYADFIPTRGYKNNFLNKTKKQIIIFIVSSLLLTIINLSFILTNSFIINFGMLLLFIFLNILIGSIFLSMFCFFLSYLLSLIKTNKKYNPSNFVYCENDFITQKKYINKWCANNNLDLNQVLN